MADEGRSKEQIQRSNAAKRGWRTRRANAKIRKRLERAKTFEEAQKVILGLPKKRRTKAYISKLLKQEQSKKQREIDVLEQKRQEELAQLSHEQYVIYKMTEDWVSAVSPEQTRADGSIALQPSRARHLPETNVILKRLRKFDKWGRLEEAVEEAAEYLDLPVREIYTLWFSP